MDLIAATAATTLLQRINTLIVNPIIILLFSIALVVFIWGVVLYIKDADNTEAREKGAKHIFWGIVGMAIMVMAFSIIKIVANTVGADGDPQTREDIDSVLR